MVTTIAVFATYLPTTHSTFRTYIRRPTLDGDDPGLSKFLETNLDSFEANWILELDLALDPSLHILGSSKLWGLSILFHFLGPQSTPIDFPSKLVPCGV
jgi:hypothetical protein